MICLLVSLSQKGHDEICEFRAFVTIKRRKWQRMVLWNCHMKLRCNGSPVCVFFRRVIMRSVNSASSTSPAGPTTAFPATPPDCSASYGRSSSSTRLTLGPLWHTAGKDTATHLKYTQVYYRRQTELPDAAGLCLLGTNKQPLTQS